MRSPLRHPLVAILVAGCLASGLAQAFHGGGGTETTFAAGYAATTRVSAPVPAEAPPNPTGLRYPLLGVVVCTDNPPGPDPRQGDPSGIGGICPSDVIRTGDIVEVVAADDLLEEVSFSLCVDTDFNDACRPEFPEDHLAFAECDGDGESRLLYLHRGPPGRLGVYLNPEADASPCAGTTGTFTVRIAHAGGAMPCDDGLDGDGDGRTDFPDDTGCASPSDPWEADDPACSDGMDNDSDGRTDALDLDCAHPFDTSESRLRLR